MKVLFKIGVFFLLKSTIYFTNALFDKKRTNKTVANFAEKIKLPTEEKNKIKNTFVKNNTADLIK